ncbi:GtrA family protein [Actinocrinis sp.]|jgi:putative flippase GtrA|uniref:GtrA family protein n=1 Tax=Actinocrinis sp. TaxID=1920516 RepID=UPI002D12B2F0|nr:GtrA family protein [Actinocrinis sp.]HXR73531.1 GtrA family protein [Actinocrinis sp.]
MRRWVVGIVRRLWREMVGFSAVGIVGVTCDIATFNLVIGVFHAPKVYGSIAGTALGTLIGYLGNRYWVFRRRERRQSGAEITLYLLVSAVGMLITAACVAFNEYVLGYTSLLAANIAQFIVGQGLGTVFRFWAMHMWVFPESHEDELAVLRDAPIDAAVIDTAAMDTAVTDTAPPHLDEDPDAAALVDSRC